MVVGWAGRVGAGVGGGVGWAIFGKKFLAKWPLLMWPDPETTPPDFGILFVLEAHFAPHLAPYVAPNSPRPARIRGVVGFWLHTQHAWGGFWWGAGNLVLNIEPKAPLAQIE